MNRINPLLAATFNTQTDRRESERRRTEQLREQRAAKNTAKYGNNDFASVLASALVGYR